GPCVSRLPAAFASSGLLVKNDADQLACSKPSNRNGLLLNPSTDCSFRHTFLCGVLLHGQLASNLLCLHGSYLTIRSRSAVCCSRCHSRALLSATLSVVSGYAGKATPLTSK